MQVGYLVNINTFVKAHTARCYPFVFPLVLTLECHCVNVSVPAKMYLHLFSLLFIVKLFFGVSSNALQPWILFSWNLVAVYV